MDSRRSLIIILLAAAVAACGQGPSGSGSGTAAPSPLEVVFEPLAVEATQIAGVVFHDANDSGIEDTGEPGLSGVTVTLDGTRTTTTDVLGAYSFGITTQGIHSVVETDPAGYTSTTPNTVSVAVSAEGVYEVDFGDSGAQASTIVDVKPGSSRNPINLTSRGVTPVAVLGSASLDVRQIDPASVFLEGVPPVRYNFSDPLGECSGSAVADTDGTPDLSCPDGNDDMILKFDTQALAAAIGKAARGDVVTLHFTAALRNGTPIADTETVTIVKGN